MTDYNHTLTNPGAESGDTTGWTSITGSNLTVRTASPAPHSGTYYFYSSDDTEFRYYQRVDLVTDSVPTATIDSGGIWFWVTWWQSSYQDADQGEIQLRFLNSSQVEISTASSGLLAAPEDVWNQYIFAPILPANTRYVDIIMHGYRTLGTACDAYFDDITAKSTDTNTTDARLTQHFVEVLRSSNPNPDARLTQHFVEVLRSGNPNPDARLTQHFVEVLRSSNHIFNNTFKDNTAGQAPPGITRKWGSIGTLEVVDEDGVVDSKITEEDGRVDSSYSPFYTLDDPYPVDDAEVLVKIRLVSKGAFKGSSDTYFGYTGVFLRATDTYSSRDAVGVFIRYNYAQDKFELQLGYWDNAVWTTLGSEYNLTDNGLTIQWDRWFYIRLQAIGEDIKAKAWGKRDTEPTDYQIEQTDSTISAAGYIGWLWRDPTSNYVKHKIDFINIILDGISAPALPYEGAPTVIIEKSNVDVLAEDAQSNSVQMYKSTVDVLTEVPQDIPKVDSNVIVL